MSELDLMCPGRPDEEQQSTTQLVPEEWSFSGYCACVLDAGARLSPHLNLSAIEVASEEMHFLQVSLCDPSARWAVIVIAT